MIRPHRPGLGTSFEASLSDGASVAVEPISDAGPLEQHLRSSALLRSQRAHAKSVLRDQNDDAPARS